MFVHVVCLFIVAYPFFGCEITSKALPKLVNLFTVTETFEDIKCEGLATVENLVH